MVRFLVCINNKPKTDNRFTFSSTVRLTEPYLPLKPYITFVVGFVSRFTYNLASHILRSNFVIFKMAILEEVFCCKKEKKKSDTRV